MKITYISTIASLLVTSAFGKADGIARLPEGKAIKFQVETSQTMTDEYFKEYPDRSRKFTNGTFNNTYISDGKRFRMEMEVFFGTPPELQDVFTVAYDGLVFYGLREPAGVLTIYKDSLNLTAQGTGEQISSPLQPYYNRNPLIAMFHWQISSFKDEAKLFSFDRIITAFNAIEKIYDKALPETVDSRSVLAATTVGYDPLIKDAPTEFSLFFDPKTKKISGWRTETRDKFCMQELTIDEWREIDCGDGKMLQLPQRVILTRSYDMKRKGNYKKQSTLEMKIVSATLVDATEPGLFTIDPSTAKSIYDPKLGRSVPIKQLK